MRNKHPFLLSWRLKSTMDSLKPNKLLLSFVTDLLVLATFRENRQAQSAEISKTEK